VTCDRLEALMVHSAAAWEHGRYMPYHPDELRLLEAELEERIALELPMRRALACRNPDDLEWTVLLVPGLAALLDQATGEFGGAWPVMAATTAVATRVQRWIAHADDWAAGAVVDGPSVLHVLSQARLED
jgi:hypothetical protein